MNKRRTNWDRVAELNEILGPVIEKFDWRFSLLKNAKDFCHPYCLCYKMSPENSLDFKGMKAMAQRMRAAYENGGSAFDVYMARYAN